MPRLAERFRTRWGYAVVAGFAGFLTAAVTILVFHFNSTLLMQPTYFLYGLMGVPAAMVCWPASSPRSTRRMIAAGVLTVLSAFLLLGLLLAIIEIVRRSDDSQLLHEFAELPMDILGVAILASIITLGIPYLIGAVISVLFAD